MLIGNVGASAGIGGLCRLEALLGLWLIPTVIGAARVAFLVAHGFFLFFPLCPDAAADVAPCLS